jgi:PncC family amidohydrolase
MTRLEVPGDRVEDVAAELVELLLAHRHTLATAESLTGGLVGAAVTAVPGCSAVYRGGVVSYATDLKAQLLDVDARLLDEVGPVHPAVARAMADGAARRLGADYAVATTGVAGPSPQGGKAPGTVFVGVHGPRGSESFDASVDVDGPPPLDREAIRRATTVRALRRLRDVVRQDVAASEEERSQREDAGRPGR